MRSRTLISFSAMAGFVVLAFGSGDMSGLSDLGVTPSASSVSGNAANEPACRAYIEAYNALDCLPAEAKLNADNTCGMVGMSSTDMTGYYECLAKGYSCNEQGFLDASGATECSLPSN